ncbi:hypothetical protein [Synoicihabitans lomoniglobus]|uniref:Xylose isomerase n=1 Tax=Synoicihabitans lomoniglobus TaxID=2909285 RepID=A0AAF0CGR1_9BACT|nr:hypothetical protein [Opitutaceae bacterium LMO-M01]WED63707.1 hypothetical protein PXH66_15330 [Opitutaceae bacterium LMO-M01]
MIPAGTAATPSARSMLLFGSLWSLRHYPTTSREWSWRRKLAAMRAEGFDGVFAPAHPALHDRGPLRYWAATSLGVAAEVAPAFAAAKELGALTVNVQLGDYDSPLAEMVKLASRVRAVARDFDLPFTIETHRDTCTETPEATFALIQGYRRKTGEALPLCLDHSHFAVIRHLKPDTFWERLREPAELLADCTRFHLRPFNGHHCQIPVLSATGRRTPEYRDWQNYAAALFHHLRTEPSADPVFVVPELGHDNPAYGLSCFGDTWHDVQTLTRDLRRLWRSSS